jgi:peptidoglycan-associated lipoprotein
LATRNAGFTFRTGFDGGIMSGQTSIIVVSALVAGLALGCGSDPVATPNTAAAAATAGAAATNANTTPVAGQVANQDKPRPKYDSTSPTFGVVHIEDRIVKACGDIPTMHFAFDSADIDPAASTALIALARCFTTGALAGHGMKLIGHADMRGETEYNFGLGQKRAGSVAEFLAKKGLESERVSTTSRGEIEATGADEDGWAQDRHVEVLLAD